ncbi:HD domain-containing protein [Nostocoides sp. F2B08]|uniref:HD-GYP domain-containing protein n=1 Tax=Nostocoides sp. F2B08 TaxID=2653936 RepID=UPI00126321AC|nr:HD domain-containing phosphohydrolase [Tetrasphaera sp. F2B08]KAB7746184.1 HD domain-containing protein [Tetrasphaera sp. F2B08]
MSRESSATAWTYVIGVWAVVIVLGALAVVYEPPSRADLLPLAALLLLGVLARTLPDSVVSMSGDGVRFSFFGIVTLSAAVMVGPFGGAVVGVLPTLLQPVRMRAVRRVFNAGMFGVVGLVGGFAYLLAGGVDPLTVSGTGSVLLDIGLPLIVADLAQAATNALVLSGIMTVTARVPFWVHVRGLIASTGAAYIGYGVIAFLLVVLWGPGQIHWFSAALTTVPLLVAWWVFGQFGAELEAHERTTDTLVAALDVRHPGTAGHSQRIAILCDWIGESLRLSPRALTELHTAGLLHDMGLLAARRGTDDEILRHPETGVRMLAGISFAAPALPAIGAHHERVDGSGYPRGLMGPDIPLGARIVAVADAFDALTSGTPDVAALDPRDALSQLAADRGLDSNVVDALARAVDRHGVLEVSSTEWLSRARVGERARAEGESARSSMATIAAVLAAGRSTKSWIIRHDHPLDRLAP